ncbi:MAG: hypothetical protein HKN70_14825 [Gammaproteobacteria bacterium]|nr:hypothetical protein [Gammaproteobacteria bacterium]
MSRQLFRNILMAVGLVAIAGAAYAGPAKTWEFEVRLDGKNIGDHSYTVSSSGAQTKITSDASFDVKFLFLTALKYRHSATETWRGDCLTSIDAKTITNNKKQIVAGEKQDSQLKITSTGGAETFTDCVKTFAYWNPDILDAEALLNAQTGDYVDIVVTPLGDDVVTVGSRDVAAHKFALRSTENAVGKPVDIKLWYSADSWEWLALESTVSGDRLLRYQPVKVPVDTPRRSAVVDRRISFYKEQW